MKPAKPSASDGFSLIEALAALALTATIVLALSEVTGQWLPNWQKGFGNLQRADLLGLGLERIVADVSAAEFVTASGGARSPLFDGDASSLMFVRSATGPDSYPHLEVVRFAPTRDDRGLALTRARAPFTPTAPRAPAQSFAYGDAVAVIRAPFRISFAYAGADRVWVESWRGKERLPDAVRITVRDMGGNRLLAVSTAVCLRVTAPAVPQPGKAKANGASAEANASAPQTAPPVALTTLSPLQATEQLQ